MLLISEMRIRQLIIHNLHNDTLTCEVVRRKKRNLSVLHQEPSRTLKNKKIEGGNEGGGGAHTHILSGGPEFQATALDICPSQKLNKITTTAKYMGFLQKLSGISIIKS